MTCSAACCGVGSIREREEISSPIRKHFGLLEVPLRPKIQMVKWILIVVKIDVMKVKRAEWEGPLHL